MFRELVVTGPDAGSFLQAQLSQDIDAVTATRSPLAAWCSPQGRVIAVLRLLRPDDDLVLVVPATLADTVRDGLLRYRLRARLSIEYPGSERLSVAVANDSDLASLDAAGLLPAMERDASRSAAGLVASCLDPARQVVEVHGASGGWEPQMPLSETHWRAARIAAGIADLDGETSGRFTPHMLNLDRLGAVSFDKGCYPGQEIVARTQHLGNVKRRLAAFESDGELAPGTKLDLDGTSVGEVVASAGSRVLALLPVDLHGATLATAGRRVTPAG